MNNIKLPYNVPTEVSEKAFNVIMNEYDGTCAGKVDNGKYFIMLWLPKYKNYIKQIIIKYPI